MLAPVTHFTPLVTVRQSRLLPSQGRVVARKGQKVNPQDVIAEATLAPEHLVMEISPGLGLPPAKADQYLRVKEGDEVSEGDILAGPVGMLRRVVTAPRDGKVIVAGNGQVLLELKARPYELRAGLPGTVIELVDERGAIIETTGSLIEGAWGNGKVEYGVLSIVAHTPSDELTTDRLDVSQRGAVLVGGYCQDPEVLKAASDIPLRALVLASMSSALIPQAVKCRCGVVLIDGFGKIPMNPVAFKLLSTSDRRDVAILPDAWDRLEKPRIIIPVTAGNQVDYPKAAVSLAEGQKVRVLDMLHRVSIGTIVALRPGMTLLENGVRAPAAEIQLENGEKAVYPLANLEVLG